MAKSAPPRPRPRPRPAPRGPERSRRRREPRVSPRARRIIVLAAIVLVAVVGLRGLAMRGEIAGGVAVSGVALGGLDATEAREKLRLELGPRLDRAVATTVDDQTAEIVPAEADVRIDYDATVDAAMRTGRLRSLLLPIGDGREVPAVLRVPNRPRIPANLRAVAEPPRSAKVKVVDGATKVTPARSGRSVSPPMILRAAAEAALAERARVRLTSREIAPPISTAEARVAADKAEDVASAPVTLFVDGKRAGAIPSSALASALVVREEDGEPVIAFSPKRLQPAIGEALGSLIREPVNAMWDTDGERAWVTPARDGRGFQPRAAADAVRAAALAGGARHADIELRPIEPGRSTAEAEGYRITQKVAGAVTDLGDSSAERIHNVALMAEILDNRLVMPGERFSFNDAVGPRTPERGFQEGMAIAGGLLIPSIGGGVCQVSSTLYDAAFRMGLSIEERTNHEFYISHYGDGMDATVSWDGPDLKFRNDTERPILIRATADASRMIVNLYSAPSDGRVVETSVSERYDIEEPEPRYLSDPLAPEGKIIEYSTGAPGFSVDVRRTVTRDGEVLSENVFVSTYRPEAKLFLVGPGAFPPGDAEVEAPPYGWVSPFA